MASITCARDDEVDQLLRVAARWAAAQPDVRALALVGSWARGAARIDSDVDLVLLTDAPDRYVEREDWAAELGGEGGVRSADRGALTERRFALASGLVVDVGVGTPAWASVDPVDPGTARVAGDGLRPLFDPDGVLARLGGQ